MSKKNTIRKDKTCLNCNYVVDNRFCSNCGQENIDTRKSFSHLFIHFFEDLTHYENAFWRTIKNLIFKPASLTKEYLSGKRMSYLAPVRLYIFISFVTFFLISILPEKDENDKKTKTEKKAENNSSKSKKGNQFVEYSYDEEDEEDEPETETDSVKKDTVPEELKKIIDLEKRGLIDKKYVDSIKKYVKEGKEKEAKENDGFMNLGKHYKSVAELDSIQEHGKESEKMGAFQYWFNRKSQVINDKYTSEEIKEKFIESFKHNFPKALFVYMPLFAFVLWLFQNKKRWYYFDHGIFTLHYFSFLLLGSLIIGLTNYLTSFLNEYVIFKFINGIVKTIITIYMLYYFFPAHHRFYNEKRITSIVKGTLMFFINSIFMLLILLLFAIYSFLTIH